MDHDIWEHEVGDGILAQGAAGKSKLVVGMIQESQEYSFVCEGSFPIDKRYHMKQELIE